MNIRLLSVSAVAAISLTCAKTASAGTSVQVSYVAPAIVYAPPRRVLLRAAAQADLLLHARAHRGGRTGRRARGCCCAAAEAAGGGRIRLCPAPAVRVMYAQPVLAAPVVVVR